jgi:Icc-related predicted phosphoesterase
MRGTRGELAAFDDWLAQLPHAHKLFVAGNHDWLFERGAAEARALLRHATYLQDSGAEIGGLHFWGSPWQPWFLSWAFNLPRGPALRVKWDLIPLGTDVLITHGPPSGILDRVKPSLVSRAVNALAGQGEHVGCRDLREASVRIAPRLHVFGHIHESYGREQNGPTTYVNASSCDAAYEPIQPPIVIDVE